MNQKEFIFGLNSLINEAIQSQLHPIFIIGTLDLTRTEFSNQHIADSIKARLRVEAMRANQEAEKTASGIVGLNGEKIKSTN